MVFDPTRNGVSATIVLVEGISLSQSIRDAIDSAPWKYELRRNGFAEQVENDNFRGKRDYCYYHDRRHPDGPEIKSSGYYFWNRKKYTILLTKSIEGRVVLWEDAGRSMAFAFITSVDNDQHSASLKDYKETSKLAEWFTGRVLYHFSESIVRIELEPHAQRPEW